MEDYTEYDGPLDGDQAGTGADGAGGGAWTEWDGGGAGAGEGGGGGPNEPPPPVNKRSVSFAAVDDGFNGPRTRSDKLGFFHDVMMEAMDRGLLSDEQRQVRHAIVRGVVKV